MNHETISKRYAKALFEIAVERKITDKISKDMETVQEIISSSPELLGWLDHPATDNEKKKEIFSKLFSKVNAVTLHFLYVIIDHHRESILQEIIGQFYQLFYEARGEVEAKVTSAFPLDKGDKKLLIQTFHKILNKQIILKEVIVDSDLLGGVIVQVGDRIFDGSLKTKLVRFQERLKKTNVGS